MRMLGLLLSKRGERLPSPFLFKKDGAECIPQPASRSSFANGQLLSGFQPLWLLSWPLSQTVRFQAYLRPV